MESKAEGKQEHAEKMPDSPFRVVEGVKIPALFEPLCKRPMEEHVARLKTMELNSDDIMLMAFAKSGTHWIWEVASMLLSGKAEYEKRSKEFAMMEATEVEKLESQSSPRILNSHLPFRLLPQQIKEKKVKVIHVYRNIKDLVVSAYFHFRQMPPLKDITFEDVERMMANPDVPGSNYFEYLKDMDEYRKNNPDVPFFTMSFEDTKEDPEKAIQRLAEFLGVELSPELCKDIAQATNFANMKQANETKQHVAIAAKTVTMYRKGQVGDWKNYLTVAQSERLDALVQEQLGSCDYRFRFTL